MGENRRFSGGRSHREYLLRGLVQCEQCGASYSGAASTSNGYRYLYYSSQSKRATREKRLKTNHSCTRVRAEWLEELVWSDVRSFLKNPEEILERARAELAEDTESEDLEQRHASLTRRLAAKQAEKGRYVKLYAQGHLDEEELEVHLVDLKNQVENLRLLISSVEAEVARKEEDKLTAQTTEAWLLTLRERVEELEEDTEDALERHRELVKLLVEQITVDRNEEGHTQARITYRFGPPLEESASIVGGIQKSLLWYNAGR